ncbi:MAG: RidA family protein [Pseudomonadota bacterium]
MIHGAAQPVAPFSHAVEAEGWVILTGQMPTDPDDADAPLPPGIQAQTHAVMRNLEIVLAGLGLDLSHVLQCRCYLTEFERDYPVFNDTYQTYFPQNRRPARTTVGVTALAVGALVEIDMIARRPTSETSGPVLPQVGQWPSGG